MPLNLRQCFWVSDPLPPPPPSGLPIPITANINRLYTYLYLGVSFVQSRYCLVIIWPSKYSIVVCPWQFSSDDIDLLIPCGIGDITMLLITVAEKDKRCLGATITACRGNLRRGVGANYGVSRKITTCRGKLRRVGPNYGASGQYYSVPVCVEFESIWLL